ncbi:MAG: 7,8-didemethyl-8-hydroxy-5-deazariboflavin synthase subunit CofH, partial [Xenococcaceae cyanobacterium]
MDAIEAILERSSRGEDISEAEGLILLQQTDSDAITAIRQTADLLRKKQVGDTVTYVINRNLNFTNICEQHCS